MSSDLVRKLKHSNLHLDEPDLRRVCDLIRRTGVEDAEHLIRKLEVAFTGRMWPGGEQLVSANVSIQIPMGVGERFPLWTAKACPDFTTDGVWPYGMAIDYARAVIRAPGANRAEIEMLTQVLVLTYCRNGIEVARWPAGAFTGYEAVPFKMRTETQLQQQLYLSSSTTILAVGAMVTKEFDFTFGVSGRQVISGDAIDRTTTFAEAIHRELRRLGRDHK